MNIWTKRSIELANSEGYLDELYNIYPIKQNNDREIDEKVIDNIRESYTKKDKYNLVKNLLEIEIFPIKDSYISYFRKDKSAMERNPKTVQRIANILLDMSFDDIIERCKTPKESNRQIGPMFKNWIKNGSIGLNVCNTIEEFDSCNNNAILNASDIEMEKYIKSKFDYKRIKGIDFIAKKNNKYIIGEAKFLTDYGGHQNAQFDDALATINAFDVKSKKNTNLLPVAIADGVIYIRNNGKMFSLLEKNSDKIVLSALLLKGFIKSI